MEYATTEEVAEHYRTTPGTVRYWRRIGYGPLGFKVGRKVLYSKAELERFDAEKLAQAQMQVAGVGAAE